MRTAFSPALLKYLTRMPLYAGVAWEGGTVPCIIVKLPETASLSRLTITCGPLRRWVSSKTQLTLSLQEESDRPRNIDCLLSPVPDAGLQVVQRMLTAKQIEMYAVTAQLRYLGSQRIPWEKVKRQQLELLLYDLFHPREQEALWQAGKNRPSVSPLHEHYRQTLQEMHQVEESTLHFRELLQKDSPQHHPLTQMHQLRTLHAFEEHVLAHTRPFELAEQHLEQLLTYQRKYARHPPVMRFPHAPVWIDCPLPLPHYWRQGCALLCFRASYEPRPFVIRGEKLAYRSLEQTSPWRFDVVDHQGGLVLRLLSRDVSGFQAKAWVIDPAHICPTQTCQEANNFPTLRAIAPKTCAACEREVTFWREWGTAVLAVALGSPLSHKHSSGQRSARGEPTPPRLPTPPEQLLKRRPSSPLPDRAEPAMPPSHVPPNLFPPSVESPVSAPAQTIHVNVPSSTGSETQVRKPVIVTQALLIDRYIHRQPTAQKQEAIEQATKYLWMHSAWAMAHLFRAAVSPDALLRLPKSHLYIELEQPRPLFHQRFAACSLLRLLSEQQQMQRWQFNVIDPEGTSIWSIWYEANLLTQQGIWTVTPAYRCPQAQCQPVAATRGNAVQFCELCQQRAEYYTTWIAVALRMIAGDFQEQVELRAPEEVLEVSTRQVQDAQSGTMQEKTVLRRFRVMRYYDACRQRTQQPQTKRGSWMSDKPLAESEYDPNPDAIIYVQIHPRDHERTYRHDRYTRMKGKSQHIDPKPRLQPMTIATFRQLPIAQRITKVYASSFQEVHDIASSEEPHHVAGEENG